MYRAKRTFCFFFLLLKSIRHVDTKFECDIREVWNPRNTNDEPRPVERAGSRARSAAATNDASRRDAQVTPESPAAAGPALQHANPHVDAHPWTLYISSLSFSALTSVLSTCDNLTSLTAFTARLQAKSLNIVSLPCAFVSCSRGPWTVASFHCVARVPRHKVLGEQQQAVGTSHGYTSIREQPPTATGWIGEFRLGSGSLGQGRSFVSSGDTFRLQARGYLFFFQFSTI